MNVDKSIRILEKICLDEYNNYSLIEKKKIINEFLNIPNKNKPINFRNLKFDELKKIFDNLNRNLRFEISKELPNVFPFKIISSSNDNKKGSDALVIYYDNKNEPKKINLELKFGSETLANIGHFKMNEIFSLKEQNFLKINKIIYNHQRKCIDNGIVDECELINELNKILFNIVIEIKKWNLIPNTNEINKLLISTGSTIKNVEKIIKYKISPYDIKLEHVYDVLGKWMVDDISLSNNSSRIQIILKNNNIKLKFLLNWKNNYEYPKKSGIKYSAKTGGTTSSWNVWIYVTN